MDCVTAQRSGRRNRTLISWFKARQRAATSPSPNAHLRVSTTTGLRPAVPESNRAPPRRGGRASLEGWHLCCSAKDTYRQAEGEGVEPSRPGTSEVGGSTASRRLPSPVGLPFRLELRRQE